MNILSAQLLLIFFSLFGVQDKFSSNFSLASEAKFWHAKMLVFFIYGKMVQHFLACIRCATCI